MSSTLEDVKTRYPGAQTFKFGDSATMSAELLALVRAGVKTATCGALRDYPEGSADMPVKGRRDIALEWDDCPALVIETVEVSVCRYCDVTEDFALAEGENETLDGWREDHRRYFERNGGFDPEMELVCERFRMVEDLAEEQR
ncbi:ASCH domain-containing protein [Roseobacter sp. HKCCD9010]|uniref:ASCH domain-containing protein n=1 Tax=unclassified Roseobacter TaxID=196798 RepID=UPI001490BFBA|nr:MULTISPECIES: ASCH domain-containing protein [unclassified Roseobacter]MBF9049307.1 ASCH domain-containing protein [Rhodobacterales bacterium HKCCD4356]NNV11307.1 ASCH domain-containing protein [Roseobacter sp. HKCCD7357]NNV15491.1 ASCH domain-containing protein [Roseobacter sp. HKCCD8768]NNV24951.1 ASCH domain-containing protein [Roseobacter sp. HKCCD8192]NNV29208.1 ASCH domain-containing protein [Roseobacter sp. HKCCD9061]